MVPLRIRQYFKTTLQKTDGYNTLINGILTCCNSHEFMVSISGEVKHSMFSKMYLLPIDDRIVLEAQCKKCRKVVHVFDSNYDGYDKCKNSCRESAITHPLICEKCSGDTFSVYIKYEYPDFREITDLGIVETDNAFTWIWVTLRCNSCGAKYSNFIDYETA